jgi:hypothetical protein
VTVKLVESHESALAVPGASPTRYGLGRSGWVDIPIRADGPPAAVLTDWVEESYRMVAPKRLVAELDAARAVSKELVVRWIDRSRLVGSNPGAARPPREVRLPRFLFGRFGARPTSPESLVPSPMHAAAPERNIA